MTLKDLQTLNQHDVVQLYRIKSLYLLRFSDTSVEKENKKTKTAPLRFGFKTQLRATFKKKKISPFSFISKHRAERSRPPSSVCTSGGCFFKKKSALGDVRSVIPLSLDRQGCVAIVQHADIIIIIKKRSNLNSKTELKQK